MEGAGGDLLGKRAIQDAQPVLEGDVGVVGAFHEEPVNKNRAVKVRDKEKLAIFPGIGKGNFDFMAGIAGETTLV